MFFGEGTVERPSVKLVVSSDTHRKLSQFRYKQNTLTCNVCQTTTLSLREALAHWRQTDCASNIDNNNPQSQAGQCFDLWPDLLLKSEAKDFINDINQQPQQEVQCEYSDGDNQDDEDDIPDVDYSDIDQNQIEMEIKPEIYSDEDSWEEMLDTPP